MERYDAGHFPRHTNKRKQKETKKAKREKKKEEKEKVRFPSIWSVMFWAFEHWEKRHWENRAFFSSGVIFKSLFPAFFLLPTPSLSIPIHMFSAPVGFHFITHVLCLSTFTVSGA